MFGCPPKISVTIPTYNEERNIRGCLESIFEQSYPSKCLEVLIVDDHSTDQTREIAAEFPVIILDNGTHNIEFGKMIGLRHASGDLFIYLDADIRLRGHDWFHIMARPLIEDSSITGAFTRKYVGPDMTPLDRYLSYEPLQRDPIYEFFSPSIESTIVAERSGYFVCQYTAGRIPPAGRCLYRREQILATEIGRRRLFLELDNLVILCQAGLSRFAYVPEAGLYHAHAGTLRALVRKRLRNLRTQYLPNVAERHYRWFDLSSTRDWARIILWLVYAHLVLPALGRGILKAIRYRDPWCMLYEPAITLVITDSIAIGFLIDRAGRKLLKRALAWNRSTW